jgi:nucleoside-diphosphate-sugar epimerase
MNRRKYKVKGKNIFVTGASGLLGAALTKLLIQEAANVWVLINQSDVNIHGVTKVELKDLKDGKRLPHFDVVFHLAAMISNDSKDELRLFNANVLLTQRLCAELNFDRIVYSSTVSLHGSTTAAIVETSQINPHNAYAHSKLWGEHYVQQCDSFAILRFSSIYGVGIKDGVFISRAIEQALTNGAVTIMGDGERLQNYIHTDTAIDYLVCAAKVNNNVVGLAVSTTSHSNRSIADYICQATGSELKFNGVDNSPSFVYDNSKTRELIGLIKPDSEIEKEIAAIVEWTRQLGY